MQQENKLDLSKENYNLRKQIGSKDRIINDLKTEISKLKLQLESKPPRIHNERRGAERAERTK
jgi:hypothetical protein